jgi:L-lactate dehydrogenase (cytochrome)/(S)-mandelate dehydrogenase
MATFRYRLSSRSEPITIEDYRRRARRKLPDMVWAYVDYGAEEQHTLEANRSAFDRYMLRSRVLTGNEPGDLSVTIGGQQLSLPVLLAPTGMVGLSHWTGELGAAQGAERAGTLSMVSTASTYTFEEIAQGTQRDHIFQLYPWSDLNNKGQHGLIDSLMQRAAAAGYSAMVVTVDVPALGNRESERRRGMGAPPTLTPSRIANAALKPRWSVNMIRHKRVSGRNLVGRGGAKAAVESVKVQLKFVHPELNWDDFTWMRQRWDGPLFIKGVLDAQDAQRAVDLGADGVIVSNHGGRQLDGAVAALDALPAIAAKVGGQAQVLVDGGIRRGSDVVKALCLGADAVCIGRPYLYGMAVDGPAGAARVLEIMREEMLRCLTLMGVAKLEELDSSWLLPANTVVNG